MGNFPMEILIDEWLDLDEALEATERELRCSWCGIAADLEQRACRACGGPRD